MPTSARLRVARNVRRVRVAKELTQDELAHRSGINERHLRKIESGEISPTVDTLELLSRALKVELRELFE